MKFVLQRLILPVLLIGILFLGACSGDQAANSSPTTPQSPIATQPSSPQSSTPQSSTKDSRFKDLPRLEGTATVVMRIKDGSVTIEVDGKNAPITAGNFVDLVQRGFYDGVSFHRVVREPQPFVVQGGDPQSKNPNTPPQMLGKGGFVDPATSKPRNIPLEITPKGASTPVYSETFQEANIAKVPELRHTRGAVAMARSPLPDSASSQFYIALSELDFLDGNYAVFGYVTDGMAIVDKIQQGDRIESAKVTKGLENLKGGSKAN